MRVGRKSRFSIDLRSYRFAFRPMPMAAGVREAGSMIEFEELTKQYGGFTALDGVTFCAPPGAVTGFLGPNGAGKSTAMRILTGLATATSGKAHILGRPYAHMPNPARHIGTLLDASAQHAGRTGREVLNVTAIGIGASRSRVREVLDLVGLTEQEGRRRVGLYSLGMRQRLGLAHALLGDPEVLVLDEPANGLDPQGIHWMRGLLRGLADEGRTILLSSHLLHEVEQIADQFVVIGRGRIVAQGTAAQLLAGHGTTVRSADDAALTTALLAHGYQVREETLLWTDASCTIVGTLSIEARIPLLELRPAESGNLEHLFLQLTAADARGAA